VIPDDRSVRSGSQAARVSFICTANRARSPFAAALFARHARDVPVVVDSFGVLEQSGAPALAGAVRAGLAFGVDLSDHRARSLQSGALEGNTLAIGFEPAHVAAAVSTGGISPARAFLLTELADVLEIDVLPWPIGADDLESRMAHTNARRFASARVPRAVVDPVGGSDSQFERTYAEIDRLVAIVAMRLFRATGAGTG
jgi:protein-tyrosine-phosphatase